MSIKTRVIVIVLGLLLAACSSTSEREKYLALLAENRAATLNADLPIEMGALTILRANAKKSSIELMMLYNPEHPNASEANQILTHATEYFCQNDAITTNLKAGLSYQIMMRNPRGQLIANQNISFAHCH